MRMLTEPEKRLLIESNYSPKSNSYSTLFKFKIEGCVSLEHIKESFFILHQNFPVLNRCLSTNQDYFCQKKNQDINFIFKNLENEHLSFSQLDEQLNEFLLEPINLGADCLYKYILIKAADSDYYLGCCWHHILVDGTSVSILLEKLSCYYDSLCEGITINELTEIQQEKQENSHIVLRNDSLLDYWVERLQGAKFYTELYGSQYDRNDFTSTSCIFSLLPRVGEKVFLLASRLNTTPFVIFLCVFIIQLRRYASQDDITIGYSVNLRKRKELDRVGYLVNNLPFRLKLDDKENFLDLVSKIKDIRKYDSVKENVSLTSIIEKMRIKELGFDKIFNVWINQYNQCSFNLKSEKFQSSTLLVYGKEPKNDLTLHYSCKNKKISLEFEYNRKKYTDSFMQQFSCSFSLLLESFLFQHSLNILQPSLLLPDFYNIKYPIIEKINIKSCINFYFEQAQPEEIALIIGDRTITYQEIYGKVNLLSRKFISLKLDRFDLLLIYLGRTELSIISILAAMCSGIPYLVLENNQPMARVQPVLSNLNYAVIVKNKNPLNFNKNIYSYNDIINTNNDIEITLPTINSDNANIFL